MKVGDDWFWGGVNGAALVILIYLFVQLLKWTFQ